MTDDDACSIVKYDLQNGTHTHYTDGYPIFILDAEKYLGGNVHIILRDCTREPEQTVSGEILFTKLSCTIQVMANTQSNRDDLYDDVIDILKATSRGYTFRRVRDLSFTTKHHTISIQVTFYS